MTGSQHEPLVRYPSMLSGLLLLSPLYAIGRRLGPLRAGAFVLVLLAGLNLQITSLRFPAVEERGRQVPNDWALPLGGW